MSHKNIDWDPASMAGSFSDLAHKVQHGQITAESLRWFLGLNKAQREALASLSKNALKAFLETSLPPKSGEQAQAPTPVVAPAPLAPAPAAVTPTEQFTLLVDLGEVVVPAGYNHGKALAAFAQKEGEKFYYFSPALKEDANWQSPSRILKPGDRFAVQVWKQVVDRTTSQERLAFLRSQGSLLLGAQGLPLVWNQRDRLPKGKCYVSMDEEARLWKDAYGRRRVPRLYANPDGAFELYLYVFRHHWLRDVGLLTFRDLGPSA